MSIPPAKLPYNRLWTISEVAELVSVPVEQVHKWIREDAIPYVKREQGDYRIPIQSFVTCMPDLFDLEAALAAIDEQTRDAELEECPRCGTEIHRLRPGLCLNCAGWGR